MDTLRLMRTFVAIVDGGSLTAAAPAVLGRRHVYTMVDEFLPAYRKMCVSWPGPIARGLPSVMRKYPD